MRESSYLTINHNVVEKLIKIPIFKAFPKQDFENLIRLSKIRSYDPEEYIIKEGDHDSIVYFLITGEVCVTKEQKDLAVLNKLGDVFGEMAILSTTPRSASVYTVTQTVCLASEVSYLDRLDGHEKYRFGYFLYKTLAQTIADRLRTNSEHLLSEEIPFNLKKQLRVNENPEKADVDETDVEEYSPPVIAIEDNDKPEEYIPPKITIEDDDNAEIFCKDETYDLEKAQIVLKCDMGEIKIGNDDIIGRVALGKELFKTHDKISRNHAQILFSENKLYIQDLESRNGTYLNGNRLVPLSPQWIKDGDEIVFSNVRSGNSVFIVNILF